MTERRTHDLCHRITETRQVLALLSTLINTLIHKPIHINVRLVQVPTYDSPRQQRAHSIYKTTTPPIQPRCRILLYFSCKMSNNHPHLMTEKLFWQISSAYISLLNTSTFFYSPLFSFTRNYSWCISLHNFWRLLIIWFIFLTSTRSITYTVLVISPEIRL